MRQLFPVEQLPSARHQPDVLTCAETAALMRFSRQQWTRNWRVLVAQNGFPPPLPGSGRRPKWSRLRVEEWIEGRDAAALAPEADRRFESVMDEWAKGADTSPARRSS
jgi:predicted DNA-binding transcriptional regulator AlpA